MIEFIQGKIEELSPTQVTIYTQGGVAYLLNISLNTFSAIQDKSEARLYVYEAIREDAYVLYGFCDKRERELFLMLISVPGIGGASARMILSTFSTLELTTIISTADETSIKRVKGIGAKTARRIIVDLRDKIATSPTGNADTDSSLLKVSQTNGRVMEEAVAALTMLGFAVAPSQKIVQSIVKEKPDISVEAVIKEALKHI